MRRARRSFSAVAETSRMRRMKACTKGSSSSSKLSSQGRLSERHSSAVSFSSSASHSSPSADDCGVPRSSEGAGAPKVHVRGRLSGGGDFAASLSVGAGDPRVGVWGKLGGTLVLVSSGSGTWDAEILCDPGGRCRVLRP